MPSKTVLQLTQELADKCGVTRTSLTTVVGLTGELNRLLGWIVSADLDIQGEHQNWRFLRRTAQWATIAGQATYTTAECGITAGVFSKWIEDSFRVWKTSTGQSSEQFLHKWDYESWRDLYQLGANRTATSQPNVFAVTPEDGIGLGPVPLAGYTILGDYYRSPVELDTSSDASVSVIPAKFDHMMIVYKAMMKYGMFESAPEVYKEGSDEYAKRLSVMELDQLPKMMLRRGL